MLLIKAFISLRINTENNTFAMKNHQLEERNEQREKLNLKLKDMQDKEVVTHIN